MSFVFLTVIAPLNMAPFVYACAAALGPGTLAFAATADAGPFGGAATHQVTSGMVPERFAAALATAPAFRLAASPVTSVTLAEAQDVLQSIDVSIDEQAAALARTGLALISMEAAA